MGRNTLKARLSRTGLWFCLPQLIGFLFVFLCPLALCVYYSMTAKSGGFSMCLQELSEDEKPSAVREQRTLSKENIILIIKILDKRNIYIYTLKVKYI